jgi:hypothetical protein
LHGTQENRRKQKHSAATAASTPVHTDTYNNAGYNKKMQLPAPDTAAATTFHLDAYHCALHSTAIKADTRHTAEYGEL